MKKSIPIFALAAALLFAAWFASRHGASAQQAPSPANSDPKPGVLASLQGRQIFPPDDPWNMDIHKEPVDPDSAVIIAGIGLDRHLHPDFGASYNGGPFGIPYVLVSGDQPKVPVQFQYPEESDPGPYPIPPDAPIEGGAASPGDKHVEVIDLDNWMLYELYDSQPVDGGRSWRGDSGAVFDLSRHSEQRRPGWTSADAAGLPIFPGLVRYDEVVERGVIAHALRFTVQRTRRAFTSPATHFASRSNNPNLPPMGMRVRLKAEFDISSFPPQARVILQALKQYGMILADNGGNWFISGTADSRWDDDQINTLKRVKGSDFEVVRMGRIVTRVDN
jgi:hypothetical protein